MKRVHLRSLPPPRNNQGPLLLSPSAAAAAAAAGWKRALPLQDGSIRRSFSSDYLSPWHFLSPWLISNQAGGTTSKAAKSKAEDKSNNDSNAPKSPSSLWETTTLRLIDSDLGSLDSFQLHEAERALSWWTSTSSSGNTTKNDSDDVPDLKAVGLAFQLLDRLCDEVEDSMEDGYHGGLGADILTYETISLAVHKWRTVVKESESQFLLLSAAADEWDGEDLSPAGMIQKIDSYAQLAPYFRPDAAIYNRILDVIGKWYPADKIPAQIQALLHHMTSTHNVSPNSTTYTSAIHVLASMQHPNAANHALAMFQTMKDEAASISDDYPSYDAIRIRPTQSAYGSVIGALARSVRFQTSSHSKAAMAQHAEDLVREMQDDWDLVPNTLIYSQVLHAWAQAAVPEAGERAQFILDSMLQHHYYRHEPPPTRATSTAALAPEDQEEDESCKPNNYCFSSVMSAYAKNGNVANVKGLLRQLQHLYEQSNGDPGVFPNAFCFNALIEACANHNNNNNSNNNQSKTCAQHAESVLEQMMAYSKTTGRDECLPNLVSFNLVLDAYAKESHNTTNPTKAAKRALAILEHMKNVGLSPDNISYNCVLECLAKCSSHSSRSSKKWAAETAEDLVTQQMSKPDVVSYRNLIRAAGTAERAEAILNDMCQSVMERGVLPDRACFNAVITQWSRSQSSQAGQRAEALWRRMKLEQNIDPDVVTYNALMECWRSVAARRPESADRALSILRHMQQQQHQGEEQTWRTKSTVKPNSISYTTCIWAFAAAKQPEKAEQVFRELEEAAMNDSTIQPNLISYCALISAWAKVENPRKAQAIFDVLVSRSSAAAGKDQNTSFRPNTAVYSALLHAWATAGEVERSVAILQQMCDDYAAGKNDSAMPDERCFSAVIGALSRSKHPDAAPQAEDCLSKMQEMADGGLDHVRPNIYTYQGVISAWANSDLPIAAERAEELLERLKQLYYEEGDARCRPNVIAYTNTLRAWSRVSRQNNRDGGYANAQLAVQRSEALLTEMLQSELPDLQPNHITYGTILRTIADSRLPDKGFRAQRIVCIMEENGAALDTFAREQVRRASL